MMLARLAYAHLIYPVYHWAKQDRVNQARAEMKASEWLSHEALNALQQKKLAQLLRFAHAHVPYYRDEIDLTETNPDLLACPENFVKLPILTKAIIEKQGGRLTSENLENNLLISNSTSGSTGTPLKFFTDSRSMDYRKASVLRNETWLDLRLTERRIQLWGSPIDIKRNDAWRGRLHGMLTGTRLLSSYDLSDESMERYANIVEQYKPALLTAYPSALEVFADFCQRKSLSFPSIKCILLSAETLWDYQKKQFEQVFQVPVYNRYGCREVGDIANQCKVNLGLHVNVERIYLEVIDDDGQPCGPGERGRLVVTDLDNYGMPLIRYEIGDFGTFAENTQCACGRAHPLLETVEGRTLDIVEGANGNKVGGTFWTILLRSKPGIKQFQIVQKEQQAIDVFIVPESGLNQDTLTHYIRKIREKCGEEFVVNFREVDNIPASRTGKRRYIINELRKA